MELTDLFPLEKWKELEKEITCRSGLDANIFNTNGIRITDYKHWANRLCPAIKATDKGQSYICAVAHMNLSAQAKQTQKSLVEECDAGLAKIIVPIFKNDEFLGTVGACGFLLDGGEVDSFLVNMTTGIDEEDIKGLSADIETISTEKTRSVVSYIEEEISKIISNLN